MITRATALGTLKSYRANLNKSLNSMNSARTTVLTQRNFNSYAENPAAAAKSFQLRRSRMAVESQYTIADSTYRKYQSGWSALLTVVDDVDNETKNSVKEAALRALNDPTGDARRALGKELSELADTIVQTMNNKYGENFIFSGADGLTVPFTWEGETLCYRGVPVDASLSDVAKLGDGSFVTVDQNGNYDPAGTNYLKGKTEIASEETLQTDPPVLMGTDGKRLRVNAAGVIDPAGSNYINTDETGTVSAEDYDAAVAAGTVTATVLTDASGNPVKVNSLGLIDPDGDKYLVLDDTSVTPSSGITSASTIVADSSVQLDVDVLKDTNGNPVVFDEDGNIAPAGYTGEVFYMTTKDTESITQEQYEEEEENVAKLEFLSQEGYFVDIGLGFKENEEGELIKSSAFNAALQGINFLGFGLDDDGDPVNIVSLVKQMAKICTDGTGKLSTAEYDELNRLTGKVEDAASELHTMHDDMDAATNKLKNNMELLENSFYTLQEQYAGLEDVDMVESITSFVWAQYCYNAALKVGNSILSQSLIDYMS